MDQDSVNQLLQQRVDLLQQIANSLQCAHAALLAPDYTQIPLHTKAQQDLCQQLHQLACEPWPAQAVSTTKRDDAAAESASPVNARQKALTTELQGLQARVAGLNRRYAALLRRAQRTVNIFCRVLQNSGLTYVAPASAHLSGIQHGSR